MQSVQTRRDVGCLLIGNTDSERLSILRKQLGVRGVDTVEAPNGENRLESAQEGLYAARRHGGTCVAAEGAGWMPAIALAVQLNVDRIALIAPAYAANDAFERQMRNFVRRNLFFCVAEILVLEDVSNSEMRRELDGFCRRMCNARIWRLPVAGSWMGRRSPLEMAARFLAAGERELKEGVQ